MKQLLRAAAIVAVAMVVFMCGRLSIDPRPIVNVLPGVLWHDQAVYPENATVSGNLALGWASDRALSSVTVGDAAVIRIDQRTGLVLAKCVAE